MDGGRGIERMSIIREYGKYSIYCDICGEHIDDFEEFQDAVDFKKTAGWKSRKDGKEWIDLCPDCKD